MTRRSRRGEAELDLDFVPVSASEASAKPQTTSNVIEQLLILGIRGQSVQRQPLTFFCARLSDTPNRKRNGFYLHTVPGKLLALTLYACIRRTNVQNNLSQIEK